MTHRLPTRPPRRIASHACAFGLVLVLVGSLAVPSLAAAATADEIMLSRYMRAMNCTSRALGPEWWKRQRVELVINHWGMSEPLMRTMQGQPERVLKADARCRKENELQDQPRPW